MNEGKVLFEKDGNLGRIVFDHPKAQNALTATMYGELAQICRDVSSDPTLRLVTLRGVGGKSFVAGSDIRTFDSFQSGQDGVDYERRIDEFIDAVESIPVATVAIIEGWAVGAGLILAAVCDFRVATPDARFGAPLGRTVGNCLSAASSARVANAVGVQAAKRMLLLGEMLTPAELLPSGFLYRVVEAGELAAEVDDLRARAATNAPLTTHAVKETLRRLTLANLPGTDDLIERVYGSGDFKLGVKTFLERTRKTPYWKGT